MADIKKLYDDISSADAAFSSAVSRNAGISVSKDRVKNVLFNNRKVIMDILKEEKSVQKTIDELIRQRTVLEEELADMDEANNELRRKIRELEKERDDTQKGRDTVRSKKTKTMTAVVEVEQ